MAAPIVYEDVAEGTTLDGSLFAGKRFWVAQRVPMRTHYLDLIKSNGGEVVMLEKKADYMIADHCRRDCPPGMISYEFVDKSISKGELQDPENHRAGPRLGEAREPGSLTRPAKGGRASYTAEEDRILYKWVRDAETAGGQSGGNEIYKQLETKHPRHTWQSWRDRYLRHLRTRPPSTFNIPDNAPPSPPSDQPAETTPPMKLSSKEVEPSNLHKPDDPITNKGKFRAKEDYTPDQLKATFSSEDWEELYAFVEVIDGMKDKEAYDRAWVGWAEDQDNQTAEQWRQYYEKVVRPQWLRDPVSKREQIKKRIQEKHQEQDSQEDEAAEASTPKPFKASGKTAAPGLNDSKTTGADIGHDTPEASRDQRSVQDKNEIVSVETHEITVSDDERFEQLLETHKKNSTTTAYTFFAREKKRSTWNENLTFDHTELHEHLLTQWNVLSEDARAPYIAKGNEDRKWSTQQVSVLSMEETVLSSSTALNESPKHLEELHTKSLKRIREEDVSIQPEEETKEARPIKRHKRVSFSPASERVVEQTRLAGTQTQPLEVSSGAVSYASSEDGDTTLYPEEQTIEDVIRAKLGDANTLEFDVDQATDSIETDDFKDINDMTPPVEEAEESDFPSNTPTPRATHRKTTSFDTQAILSSPLQSIPIAALPRPRYARDLSSASPDIPISALPRPNYSPRNSSEAPNPIEPPSSIHEPESEASTTQSLQEFRSFHSDDARLPQITPLPRPRRASPSPTPSSASSLSSDDEGDPDVPLTADEMPLFFDEQRTDVITDDFISKALMRTRCRPNLAIQVLDAWSKGRPLPHQRGVWSREDDEAVECGDGRALMALEGKHTLDGWGGITERLVFLEACRGR